MALSSFIGYCIIISLELMIIIVIIIIFIIRPLDCLVCDTVLYCGNK